jgi:hypothetical protein
MGGWNHEHDTLLRHWHVVYMSDTDQAAHKDGILSWGEARPKTGP